MGNNNKNMQIKIKKLNSDAITPSYAHKTDAGMDLFAIKETVIPANSTGRVETGIADRATNGLCGVNKIKVRTVFKKVYMF